MLKNNLCLKSPTSSFIEAAHLHSRGGEQLSPYHSDYFFILINKKNGTKHSAFSINKCFTLVLLLVFVLAK